MAKQNKTKNDWIYLLLLILFFLLKSMPGIFGVVPVPKKKDPVTPKEPNAPEPSIPPTTNPKPVVPPVSAPKTVPTPTPIVLPSPDPKPSPSPTPFINLKDFLNLPKTNPTRPIPKPVYTAPPIKTPTPSDPLGDIWRTFERGWNKQDPVAKVILGGAIAAPVIIGAAIAAPVVATIVGTGAVATALTATGAAASKPSAPGVPTTNKATTTAAKLPTTLPNPFLPKGFQVYPVIPQVKAPLIQPKAVAPVAKLPNPFTAIVGRSGR